MRKYIWGIAVIIIAVLAYLIIPLVDNSEETKPDLPKTIEGVKNGVEIIQEKKFEVVPGQAGVILEKGE